MILIPALVAAAACSAQPAVCAVDVFMLQPVAVRQVWCDTLVPGGGPGQLPPTMTLKQIRRAFTADIPRRADRRGKWRALRVYHSC